MGTDGGAVATATVEQVMAAHPATLPVFNAFGVDTCCGAHRTVHEAAVEDGADEVALTRALQQAMAVAS